MLTKGRYWIIISLIVFFALSLPVYAGEVQDFKGHWAETQIENWLVKSLTKGYGDGTYRPDRNVTRAEFISLANNAFGYNAKVAHEFDDVKGNDWFAGDVAKAKAVSYIAGYADGTFKPNKSISRQEAAVIICNILKLDTTQYQDVLVRLGDSGKLPGWSKDKVNAVVSLGLMAGYPDKTFRQDKPITRAEVVATLDKVAGERYNAEGVFGPETGTQTIKGNATVSKSGVTLKNTVIEGNLYLTEGIGQGNVTLDNVTVKGLTIVSGGGINSIVVINSVLGPVTIEVPDGAKVRLVAEGSTSVKSVDTRSNAKLEESQLTGTGFRDIVIQVPAGADVELKGDFNKVQLQTPNTKVSLIEGKIEKLNVSNKAAGASVNIAAGAVVQSLNLDAKASVTGRGTIQKAEVNALDVVFESKPVTITVASGITTNVAGSTVTGTTNINNTSTGGSATTQKAAAPTATPAAGSVLLGTRITLSSTTDDAVIYYSTDGSTPTTASLRYDPENNPIIIDAAKTIKAIAVKAGMTNSDMATFAYTIAIPGLPEPFVPGAGGSISVPAFASEPGHFSGLHISKSHMVNNTWELTLSFRPYGSYPEGNLALQYSADNGETWADASEMITSSESNLFVLEPDAAYQYRLAAVESNEQISNIVESLLPDANAYAYFYYLDVYSTEINNIDPPFVGSGLAAWAWVLDSIPEEFNFPADITEYLSYQWYQVNPATFEMIPIEGATQTNYTRTEADAGYLLLVRAALDGDNSGVFAQYLYYPDWDYPFTIIPNKAYVTNITENGFTLNLYKIVDGITPEDLRLYDYNTYNDLPITAVTQGQNKAIYQITTAISQDTNYLYLENYSDTWLIITEEEWDTYIGLEISRGQIIDISEYVNGGTVEGSETTGFTLYDMPGAEKITVAAGTPYYEIYSFTVTNPAQGTVQNFEMYNDWDFIWVIDLLTTELDLSTLIGAGSVAQLQGVSGFTLDNEAQKVSIDETWEVRDKKFYFDVTGGVNDGKRYKVFYNGFWQAEEVTALITTVDVTGNDSIEIKRYSSTPNTTYTAVVKDQNGDVMADEMVTWSIKVPVWGVAVGANTGIVTVANYTSTESFVLVAASATDNTVKAEKTVTLTMEDRREKSITDTSVGVLSGGNIDAVPAGTKVSVLKAGLTVSPGATVEILTEAGGAPVANQAETDVTATMVIEVTAENGDKAEYTIIMATYSIGLFHNTQDLINGSEGDDTITLHYSLGIAHWYPWVDTTRVVEIRRAGTGDITNLTVTSSDPAKFGVCLEHPNNTTTGLWTDTLNNSRNSSIFYVYAEEGLAPGWHEGSYTVTADNGISESFNVKIYVVFDETYQG